MKFGKLLKDLTDGNPQMNEQPLIRYKELKKHLKSIKKQQEGAPEGGQQGQSAAAAAAASAAAMAVQHQQDHPEAEAQPGQELPPGLSVEEQAFINMLNEDLLRFNRFFMDKEEEAVIKLQALADRIATTAQGQQQQQQQETQDLKAALVDFHGEMVLLLHWSLLNYAAVVKILKKHDKQSGLLLRAPYLANVLQQPFYSTSIMSRLVKMAEGHLETLVAQEAKHSAAAAASTAPAPAAGSSEFGAADPQAAGSSHQANTAAGPPPAAPAGPGPSSVAAAAESDRSNQTAHGLSAAATQEDTQPLTAAAATPAGDADAAAAAGDGGGVDGGGGAADPESDTDTEELLASTAVCARTRVALQTWQQLCSNASTPSTVLPANSSQALVRALNVRQRWAKLVALAPIMQQAGMDASAAEAAAAAAAGDDGVGADGTAVVGAALSDAAAEQRAGKALAAAEPIITHQQQLQPPQQQPDAKEVKGLHAGQKHKGEASHSEGDTSKRQRLDA